MSQPKEPQFIAVASSNSAYQAARAKALETVPTFRRLLDSGVGDSCCAKLRFRDPEASEQAGKDVLLYLWLSEVVWHDEEELFSGMFFEVPEELSEYHKVGERLGFHPDDLFDWLVNVEGRLYGGYSMRVVRASLPDGRRAAYDHHCGVRTWAPVE